MKKESKILLSISMLVSGREEMGRSLESLRGIKEAIPAEIILVDTGCNPEQRALAEKYADKIVDFEWCNDFAAARNAGLKEAAGKWFMYVDDDEWFEDTKEIVAFFKSGEYRKYHCASYIQRNYRDAQGQFYDDSYPSRMVEIIPETKFIGKIHEYLNPFILPKKAISDYVHHYGYVYKDEEDRRRHTERNTTLLLKMVADYPGETRWSCQLAQEYFSVLDYKMTIQVSKEGIAAWKQYKEKLNDYAPAHVGALYAYILVSMEMEKRYEEEAEWLERTWKEVPYLDTEVMAPTHGFFSLVGARLYIYLKDYEKSRNYFRQYIDYYKKYKDERALIEAGTAAVVESVFQEVMLNGTILLCMEAPIRMEDYDLAEEAFFMLDWMHDLRLLKQNPWEKAMLDGCCSVEYHPLWVKILQTLVSREYGMQEMQVVFLETEIAYKEQGELEKLFRLNRLVAELDFEHSYILTKKIVWVEKDPAIATAEERRERAGELLRQLFEKYPEDIFDVRPEVWNAAERMEIPCEPYLLQMDYTRFRRILENWCRQTSHDVIRQWEQRIEKWKTQNNIRYSLFEIKCTEQYLHRYQEVCPTLYQIEPMFWKYADAVLDMYRPFYQEFVFEEVPEVLPEEIQLALKLKKVQMYREQHDDLKALEAMRKCLGVCPAMEDAVGAYATMYRDEVKSRTQSTTQNTDEAQVELRYLIATLKRKAKQMIEGEDYQGAREILLQVQQCSPGDAEVAELLQRTSV